MLLSPPPVNVPALGRAGDVAPRLTPSSLAALCRVAVLTRSSGRTAVPEKRSVERSVARLVNREAEPAESAVVKVPRSARAAGRSADTDEPRPERDTLRLAGVAAVRLRKLDLSSRAATNCGRATGSGTEGRKGTEAA